MRGLEQILGAIWKVRESLESRPGGKWVYRIGCMVVAILIFFLFGSLLIALGKMVSREIYNMFHP
jgi:uncharacterized BrkB/YihY/UPF0761 family membrane protein